MMLQFNKDTFKIMQIADTQEGRRVSPDTIDLINAALDKAKPDLVVYSGDQIWGKTAFKGNKELVTDVLDKLTKPVRSRHIPFTICFGNHDRQVGLSNEEQFDIYKSFDYFIGESAEGIDGVANHVIEIMDGEELKFLLYLIDSHSSLEIGYDNVHQNQIDWYRQTRDSYAEKYGRLIPSIVIQHIPLCEVFELLTEVKKNTKGAVRGFRTHANRFYVLNKDKVNPDGFMKESPADPQENSGEFAAFKEKGEVLGVYFGHDHNNSYNGKVDGIDLGYTQGAGFHVYGPGKDRGVRIIELKKNGTFDTYDLRFKDLVGNKVKEPFRYAMFQIMPTNMFDAVNRAVKFFAGVGILAVIVIVLLFFFG
ncbi:MAG: metallophosphoesterase family protein [Clostridium sp.]|nr:metallophosphoesterase family protein [Clostridium sp.]